MIIGAHSIIYIKNPEADRAFLRDAIGLHRRKGNVVDEARATALLEGLGA